MKTLNEIYDELKAEADKEDCDQSLWEMARKLYIQQEEIKGTNKQKLSARIDKDMHEIEEEIKLMTPMQVFYNSYKFACKQEFYGAIDFACDDTYTGNEDYAEGFKNIERLIDYKGNLLEYLTDEYTNFRHPEYYNIFGGYEDTLNIIQIIIDECMGEEE